MPQSGIDSVTVPGVVDGWTKLHDRFGKLPWRDLFQPAIFYAKWLSGTGNYSRLLEGRSKLR